MTMSTVLIKQMEEKLENKRKELQATIVRLDVAIEGLESAQTILRNLEGLEWDI